MRPCGVGHGCTLLFSAFKLKGYKGILHGSLASKRPYPWRWRPRIVWRFPANFIRKVFFLSLPILSLHYLKSRGRKYRPPEGRVLNYISKIYENCAPSFWKPSRIITVCVYSRDLLCLSPSTFSLMPYMQWTYVFNLGTWALLTSNRHLEMTQLLSKKRQILPSSEYQSLTLLQSTRFLSFHIL